MELQKTLVPAIYIVRMEEEVKKDLSLTALVSLGLNMKEINVYFLMILKLRMKN